MKREKGARSTGLTSNNSVVIIEVDGSAEGDSAAEGKERATRRDMMDPTARGRIPKDGLQIENTQIDLNPSGDTQSNIDHVQESKGGGTMRESSQEKQRTQEEREGRMKE